MTQAERAVEYLIKQYQQEVLAGEARELHEYLDNQGIPRTKSAVEYLIKQYHQEVLAGEARELHEYLDNQGIPRTKSDPSGQFEDEHGKFYILPLIDRVQRLVDNQHPMAG